MEDALKINAEQPQGNLMNMDEAIRSVGGHNCYQFRLMGILAMVWLSSSFYLEGLVYILMDFEKGLDDAKYASATIETTYFIGIGVGSMILSWYSNNFGRKPALLVCQAIFLFGLAGTMFAETADVYAGFWFVIGLSFGGAEFAVFVLMSEYVDTEFRNRFLGLLQTMWGLSIILTACLFAIDENWRFLSAVFLVFGVGTQFIIFFADESTRFLVSMRENFPEAKRILNKVARINKLPPFQARLAEEPEEAKEAEKPVAKHYGYIQLIKYPSIRYKFIMVATCFFSFAYVYYVVTFSLPFYLNDPVTNGLVMGTAELVAVFAAIPMIGSWGRRATLLITFYGALLSSLVAVIFHAINWDNCHIVETLSLGLLKFALSACFCAIAIIITEIFPTVIRDIAFGAVSTVSRFASGVSPFVIAVWSNDGVNPLITTLFFLLLASSVSWLLPETLNSEMPDYIIEEKEAEQAREFQGFCENPAAYKPPLANPEIPEVPALEEPQNDIQPAEDEEEVNEVSPVLEEEENDNQI